MFSYFFHYLITDHPLPPQRFAASGSVNTNSSNNNLLHGIDPKVQRCNCCPYGYHIDLDFLNFCQEIASGANLKKIKKPHRKSSRPKHAPVKTIKPPPPLVPPRSASLPVHRKRRTREGIEPEKLLAQEQAAFSATYDKFSHVIRKRYINDSGEYVEAPTRRASDTQSLPPIPYDVSLSDVESVSDAESLETASVSQFPSSHHDSRTRRAYNRHSSLPAGVGLEDLHRRRRHDRHTSLPETDVELLSDCDINPNGSYSSPFSPSNLLQMSLQSESNSSLSSGSSSIPRYSPPGHMKNTNGSHHSDSTSYVAASLAHSLGSFTLPMMSSCMSGDMSPSSSGRSTPGSISAEALSAVRCQMVVALTRIKELEEQIKAIPVLSVKVNVLKEEKRLLMMQLKAKDTSGGVRTKTSTIGVGEDVIDNYDVGYPEFDQHIEGNGHYGDIPPMSAVNSLQFHHKIAKTKPEVFAKKAIVAPVQRCPVATRSVGVDANIPTKMWTDSKSIGINVNMLPERVVHSVGAQVPNGWKPLETPPRPSMTLSIHRAVQLKSPSAGLQQQRATVEEGVIQASTVEPLKSAFSPLALSPKRTRTIDSCVSSSAQTSLTGPDLDAILNRTNCTTTGTSTDTVQVRLVGTNTAPPPPKKPSYTIATDTEDLSVESVVETTDRGTFPLIFPGICKGTTTDATATSNKGTETVVFSHSTGTSTPVVMTREQTTEMEGEKVVATDDKSTGMDITYSTASLMTDTMTTSDKGTSHTFTRNVHTIGVGVDIKMAAVECATMTDPQEVVEPEIVMAVSSNVECAPPPMLGQLSLDDKPEMVSVATTYEPVEVKSIGTECTAAKMVSVATDYTPVGMVSVATGNCAPEMVSVSTDYPRLQMVSVATNYTPTAMVSIGTDYVRTEMVSTATGNTPLEMVSVATEYERSETVSVGTDYVRTGMVSVATNYIPVEMLCVGTSCGKDSMEMVSVATNSTPVEMVSVETSYTPTEMKSIGTNCGGVTKMVSKETLYSPPGQWTHAIGTGECTIHDNFCDRCDNLETVSCGVGACTVLDRVCERCDNLRTTSIGVGSKIPDVKSIGTSVVVLAGWSQTLGVGTCSTDDLLCDRCTNREYCTQGVGDCTVVDRLCERCDNLSTASVGVESKPDSSSVAISACTLLDFGQSVGVGSGLVDDVICDRCDNLTTRTLGVGDCKITGDTRNFGTNHSMTTRSLGVGLHMIRDETPTASKAVGERDVNDTMCNACMVRPQRTIGTEMAAGGNLRDACVGNEQERLVSAGSGDCTILDRVCDHCENLVTKSVAIGSMDVSRYTFTCGVQVGAKGIDRSTSPQVTRVYETSTMTDQVVKKCMDQSMSTEAARSHETSTMTDTAKPPRMTSVGVGLGDIAKYTMGCGVQVGEIGIDTSTETFSAALRESSTMTDKKSKSKSSLKLITSGRKSDTNIRKSHHETDNTMEPLIATMKEFEIVKTEATNTESAPCINSGSFVARQNSIPKVPKTPEIVKLETRRRHTDDEPLRPPADISPEGSPRESSSIRRSWSLNAGMVRPLDVDSFFFGGGGL